MTKEQTKHVQTETTNTNESQSTNRLTHSRDDCNIHKGVPPVLDWWRSQDWPPTLHHI